MQRAKMRDRSSEDGHIESFAGANPAEVVPQSMPEFAHPHLLHVTHGNTSLAQPFEMPGTTHATISSGCTRA